jgi:hypothetical protein
VPLGLQDVPYPPASLNKKACVFGGSCATIYAAALVIEYRYFLQDEKEGGEAFLQNLSGFVGH